MSLPEFELAPPPPATPRRDGWIALWLILCLYIGLQLYGYLDRKSSPQRDFLQVSQQFRMLIHTKEASRRMNLAGTDASKSLAPLDNLIAEVVEPRQKDPTAARLYVAMRYESGKKIEEDDLQLLLGSEKPEDRAFAQIYHANPLTKERATELAEKLDRRGFSYRMAEIHAFEKAGEKGARKRLLPDSEVFGAFAFNVIALAAVLAGMLVLSGFLFVRAAGKAPPKGHPAAAQDGNQANTLAGAAAVLLLANFFLAQPLAMALSSVLRKDVAGLIAEVILIGGILAFLYRSKLPSLFSAQRLFGPRERFWGDVAWGIGGFLANIPLFACCAILGERLLSGLPHSEHPVTNQLSANPSLATILLIVVLASVMAPIFEEIVFRGAMTPALARVFGGPFMGIVASSLLFAAMHPTGIRAWPALAMIGASAAMLTYQRGSLRPAIVFHAVHNLAILTMNLLLF